MNGMGNAVNAENIMLSLDAGGLLPVKGEEEKPKKRKNSDGLCIKGYH